MRGVVVPIFRSHLPTRIASWAAVWLLWHWPTQKVLRMDTIGLTACDHSLDVSDLSSYGLRLTPFVDSIEAGFLCHQLRVRESIEGIDGEFTLVVVVPVDEVEIMHIDRRIANSSASIPLLNGSVILLDEISEVGTIGNRAVQVVAN